MLIKKIKTEGKKTEDLETMNYSISRIDDRARTNSATNGTKTSAIVTDQRTASRAPVSHTQQLHLATYLSGDAI